MKILRWGNLNPTLRGVLDPDADKWTVKAVWHFFGFFIFAPFGIVAMIYSMATDTKWGQVGMVLNKLLWLFIGVLGWTFQKVRSISGTDILLICILFMLVRVATLILALHETVNEWIEEWRSQHDSGGDYSE